MGREAERERGEKGWRGRVVRDGRRKGIAYKVLHSY